MPLSRQTIRKRLDLPEGHPQRVLISPMSDRPIQPSSVDIRLSMSLRRWKRSGQGTTKVVLDPRLDNSDCLEDIADVAEYVLPVDGFVLYNAYETFGVPTDLAAKIEGRSTLGRYGYQIHSTAGWLDPGFQGDVTLEIKNINPDWPIVLYHEMWIAQIAFYPLDEAADIGYGDSRLKSKYQGQKGATGPRQEIRS